MGPNVVSWTAATLLSFYILQHVAVVGGQFTTAPPTCPNKTFTFRCTVAGDSTGITIWRVGGNRELHLLHGDAGDTAHEPGGVFTARFDATNATSFSSTLSGTATAALDGTLVECFGPTLSRNMVGNSTLQILGPPPAPSIALSTISETGSPTTQTVTISWTEPVVFSHISHYVLTVSPPAPPCASGQCLVGAGERGTQLTLNTGQRYNFTVRADNCGDVQMGNESEPLTVFLQVPAVPTSCVSTLLYNQTSGRLLSISTTWDSVPDPEEVSPGLSGNITQYLISIQAGSSVETEDVNISSCTMIECRNTFETTSKSSVTSSYDSVSVTAENVVGVGQARMCIAQPISTTNNILRVTVLNVSFPENVQLQCTFLSGFTGSAHCRVQYGTDPTYMSLPYSAESNETGMTGGSVGVALREQLVSLTIYYFAVSVISGDVAVVVQGSFTTPQYNCPLSELQIVGSPYYPQCQHNQDTVTTIIIPNGVTFLTCYSGRQFVSIASYVCDEGYQPNVSSSVWRVCRDNGSWSGTAIACEIAQTTLSTGATAGITAMITGTTALVIGVLTGVLVYHCISKYRSQMSKPEQQIGPVYEEVSASTAKVKIELRENVAYEPASLQH